MYLTRDLINSIEEFLNDEETMNFFEIKGYKPIYKSILGKSNILYLKNTKNKNIEIMEIKADRNNKNRIHLKGKNWYFSLNRDENDNIYLDHLLIGNVTEESFVFSYRYDERKNEIIIKLVDNKNVKHTYFINDSCISMERQSIKDKIPNYKNKHYNIKEYAQQEDEYEFEYFRIYKDEKGDAILSGLEREYANNCLKEFLVLEDAYISITSYIEKRIPFFSKCIDKSSKHDVKLYEIKREKNPKSPYKRIAPNNTKIYKFDRNIRFRNI